MELKNNSMAGLYREASLIAANTVILFVAVNCVLASIFLVKDSWEQSAFFFGGKRFQLDGAPTRSGKRTPYQMEWFDRAAYGTEVGDDYVVRMLDGFYDLAKKGFIYEPWSQFAEPPFNSALVNVDADDMGFSVRRTINSPDRDRKSIEIFAMGGSTTFGYHVSDEHTWPSYLSAMLNKDAVVAASNFRVLITNYGHGYYNPSQEVALLIDLLRSGRVPDLVLFLDGVNWGSHMDVPYFTRDTIAAFTRYQFGNTLTLDAFDWVPLVRLARSIVRRIGGSRSLDHENVLDIAFTGDDLMNVRNRFLMQRRIVNKLAQEFGFSVLYFVQPNVAHNYNVGLYRRSVPDYFERARRNTSEVYSKVLSSPEVVDLTYLFGQWGVDRKAVVDDVHYSPGFNRMLARAIADNISLGFLVSNAQKGKGPVMRTGRAREWQHP